MPPKARRRGCALRVEGLEDRTLLSAAGSEANDAVRTLLVRFSEAIQSPMIEGISRTLGASVVRSYEDGPTLLRLPSEAARDRALAKLNTKPWVIYAEANSTFTTTRVLPNDPGFSSLWGLDAPSDIDIDAPEAWQRTTGEPVLVAVLDTGLDLGHPDLAGKVWTNPGEIPGNGIDDDGNGFADDLHGWNFVNDTADVTDDNGHGTHVAGTIAARPNNGQGIAGISWGARILPLKVLDANGSGTTADAVDAIYYAAEVGARVINASWGGPGFSSALSDAIRSVGVANPAAGRPGTVFVAAAGNGAANNDVRPSYPANNRFANTITVAAIEPSGALASFSNHGAQTVDLGAPGSGIVSTVPTFVDPSGYASFSGTSMAAPHVSGVVALAAGLYPTDTAAQLVQRVLDGAKPNDHLAGRTVTGGLLSAAGALGSVESGGGSGGSGGGSGGGSSVVTPPPLIQPPDDNPLPEIGQPAPPAATPDPLPSRPAPVLGSATDAHVRASILSSEEYFDRAGRTFEGFVTLLYQDLLDRNPEPQGMATWLDQLRSGVSRADVASAILSSDEARKTQIAHWYQSDLGRVASIGTLKGDPGVAEWAASIARGLRPDQVRAAILASAEAQARFGGQAESLVIGAYEAILDRAPDEATLQDVTRRLDDGTWSPNDLVVAAQTLEESARAKVAHWYQEHLRRPSPIAALKDDPGVASWASTLTRG